MYLNNKNPYCFLFSILFLAFSCAQGQDAKKPKENAPLCCSGSNETTLEACRLPASTNPLSRVGRVTCTQYATARLSPDQSLIIKDSPQTKNNIAFAARLAAQRGQVSTTLKAHAHVHHPAGGILFPDAPALASAFDGVLTTLSNAGAVVRQDQHLSYFIPLFRKFQFMALSDLYRYLTSLYSTFTLMHKSSVVDYAIDEPVQAFNKKSLVVAHLLNVIQGQLFFVCAHHQPLIPQHFGLKAGALLLQHDMTVDPLFLLKNFNEPFFVGDLVTPAQKKAHLTMAQAQSTYLQALNTVQSFFRDYTAYLARPDPHSRIPGSTFFARLASRVAQVISQDPFGRQAEMIARMPNTSSNETKNKIAALRNARKNVQPINPPLFHYDKTALRAIQVIPRLAQELPVGSQLLGWPEHLIKSAQAGTQAVMRDGTALGYVVAYFEDAQKRVTTDISRAVKLFINLPTVNGPYAQEILRQPAWLNTAQGIINMLRACLGDYAQLVGMQVLSPCVEQILCVSQGADCAGGALAECQSELALMESTHNAYMQALATGGTQKPPPQTTTTSPVTQPVVTQPVQSGTNGYPSNIGGYFGNSSDQSPAASGDVS